MKNIITKSIALSEETWSTLERKTKESGYETLDELLQAVAQNYDRLAMEWNRKQETAERALLEMLLKGAESEPVLMTDSMWGDLQARSISRRQQDA